MQIFKKFTIASALLALLIATPACASHRTHHTHRHAHVTLIRKRAHHAARKRSLSKLSARQFGLGTYQPRYLGSQYVSRLSRQAKHSKAFKQSFIHASRRYYQNNAYSPSREQLNQYTHRSLYLLKQYQSQNHIYRHGWLSSNPANGLRPVKQWSNNYSYRHGFNDGYTYYNGIKPSDNSLFDNYIQTGGIKD